MKLMTRFAPKALAEKKVESISFMEAHLTEDQIDAQLLGDLDQQGADHLAECAACTRRVVQAAAPMASFREKTMAWGERRSATMPMPAVEAQGLIWQRRMGWVMATFVLGAGMALVNNRRNELAASVQQAAAAPLDALPVAQGKTAAVTLASVTAAGPTPMTTVAANDDRFAADNTMLKAVDGELTTAVESPAVLGLEAASEDDHSENTEAQTALRD